MKRPLEYAAGGFVLGEVLALLSVAWIAGILAVVTAGVLYLRKNGRSRLCWLLPVFCVWGLLWIKRDERIWQEYCQRAQALEGQTIELTGTVSGLGGTTDGDRQTLELTSVTLTAGEEMMGYGDVLAYTDRGEARPAPGMRVRVTGKLEMFDRPGNRGEFDLGAYYHGLGLEGRFYGDSLEIVDSRSFLWLETIRRLKAHAAGILGKICTEKDRGIFRAMVLGDKTELSGEIRSLYQRNGIAHILAVSGLHISMIGMGTFSLLRRAGLGPVMAGTGGAAVTVGYGLLAGGAGLSASVIRAVMMAVLQMAALCVGRTYDMMTAVCISAVALLLQSPTLLFQAGFQLSFGAVLALGAAEPVVEQWLKAGSGLQKAMTAAVVIQLATCPLVMYHYFEYPVYGICLNLVVIPLMSWVLLSGILGTVLGTVDIRLGMVAVGTGHYILEFYQWLCEKAQKLPGAVFVTGRPGLWQTGLYGAAWILFLSAAAASAKREREEEGQGTGRGWRRGLFLAVFAAGTLGLLMVRFPEKGMEVTFLDVGQGDGICIRTGETVILVDGGSLDRKNLGDQVLEPFLKSRGITRVDYAVVSHGDQDHVSGLKELLEGNTGIRISHVILPWLGKEEGGIYETLELGAQNHGAEVRWMKRGDRLKAGALEMECLYAGQEGTDDRNDHSLLLSVTYGTAGILLTGDMSREGEQQWLLWGEQPEIQVLKVAHHGSAGSSGTEFLQRVRPVLAVISCGKKNRYGHPAPETLERLKDLGISWETTEAAGAVTVWTDGNRLRAETFREP